MAILGPLMALVLACAPARAGDVAGRRDAGPAVVPQVAAPSVNVQPLNTSVGMTPGALPLSAALPASVSLPPSAIAGATRAPQAAAAGPASAAPAAARAAAAAPAGASQGAAAQETAARAADAPQAGPAAYAQMASALAAAATGGAPGAAGAPGAGAGRSEAAQDAALAKMFDNSLKAPALAAAAADAAAQHGGGLSAFQLLKLADTLGPLEAPIYYQKAVERAQRMSAPQAKGMIHAAAQLAAQHADTAIFDVVTRAFEQAKAGQLKKDPRAAAFYALKFWNGALEHAGKGPLKDLEGVKSALMMVQTQAAAGKDTSGWQLSFTKVLSEKPFKLQVNIVDQSVLPKPEEAKNAPPPLLPGSKQASAAPVPQTLAGKIGGLWTSFKGWLNGGDRYPDGEQPQAGLGPVAAVDPQTFERLKQSLGPDDIIAHRPRGRVYRQFGYQLLHEKLPGLPAAQEADLPVIVKVGRSGDPQELAALRERFDTFNRLIEDNFAALELIAQNPHAMTFKQVKAVFERVQRMAEAYQLIAGADDPTAKEQAGIVIDLGTKLVRLTSGFSDSDPVPAAALQLVVPLEKKSLHRAINTLHQLALERVGRVGADGSANFLVELTRGADQKKLALVDLSNDPLVKDGRIVSPGFKALTEALAKSADTPNGSLIMQDHQFWGHFKLGAHSAEIYANFLPPDEGGMIRVRYQEWGTDIYNQARLYYVARTLEKLGFAVDSDNGFLTAVVDKDHQSQTADQMRDSFSMVVQALHATVGLDFALPIILKGSTTSEESGRRIDEWVKIVLAEGGLPFYERDQHENMVRGFRDYEARAPERAKLENVLEAELRRLGLPEMPLSETLGQRTIDKYFNEPVERALARGELRAAADGTLQRVKDYDPLKLLARDLSVELGASARLAEAVGSLDPGLFQYQTLGSIGALTVQRAQRRLDDDTWLNVYALRDPQTGQIALAKAELGGLSGAAPRPVGPEKLFALLAEQGHPVAAFTPTGSPAALALYLRKLRQNPQPNPTSFQSFSGLAASPGPGRPVTAQVTFDRKTAAKEPRIFAAPYTDPDDLDAIRNAKAVVTTSGGLLSHAAITTREMGIGAVILSQAEWRGGKLVLTSDQFGPSTAVEGLPVRRVVERREVEVSEGDLLRVDPGTGRVDAFPKDVQPLIGALSAALDAYDEGSWNGAALSEWARRQVSGGALDGAQQLVFTRELLSALTARAGAGATAASDLSRVRAALRAGASTPLASHLTRTEDQLFGAERASALLSLRALQEQLPEAVSLPGVERLSAQASAQLNRLQSLAAAYGRPAGDLKLVEGAYDALKRAADERASALLAADMKELEEHLRLYPAVTADALPKIKALVAKAKRRGLGPTYYAAWEAQIGKLESSRRTKRLSAGPLALKLSDVLDVDVPLVGGKGAKLGEIADVVARAGGKTAPGIALTVQAYREFIKTSGIQASLEGTAARRDMPVDERSARIQKLIRGAKLSPDSAVGAAILTQLRAAGLEGKMLAVRSSAVDEDGAAAAFAGAGDTHLYVSEAELLDKVKEVWASLYNPRALLYRESKGLTLNNLAQAVVIQAMVPSEVSGVAFTEDPVSGNTGRVVVNAAFGLGEGIVSGRVAPDQYVLSKRTGRELLPAMISDKKVAVVRGKSGKGSEEQKVAPERRRARALSPAQLEKLTTVASALENHFGYALDIEFAFVGEQLFILQARAVTTADTSTPPAPVAPVRADAAQPVLFVCAGNTCRSPMAAVMLRQELKDARIDGVPVASRGLYADEGRPINPKAAAVLAERGLDASDHRSSSLTDKDVSSARLILVMEPAQKAALLKKFPASAGKVHLLTEYAGQDPRPVSDPYGGTPQRYEAAAHQLEVAVGQVAKRLQGDLSPAR